MIFAEVAELVDALVSKINELYARAGSIPAFGTKEYSVLKTISGLNKYIRPYYFHLLFATFVALLFALSNVYFLPLVRDISKEISKQRVAGFNWQMVNLIVLWTIRVVTQFGQQYLTAWISHRILIDIKQGLFNHYQLVSQHFYSNWRLGDLLARLFDDSVKVQQAIMKVFSSLLPQTLTLVGVIIYLSMMSWTLTIFTLISVPLFVFVISYFTNIVKRIAIKIQEKISTITHLAQESLMNIKVIQAYTLESFFIKKFKTVNHHNMTSSMMSIKFTYFKSMLELFLQGCVFILLIFVGGTLVSLDQMTGPELISYFLGCGLLIDPILAFSSSFSSLAQAIISLNRINDVLAQSPRIFDQPAAIDHDIKGVVEFKNVSFQYVKTGEKVLDDISFSVKPGEMIAIVGLSGGGKSTLIDMIPRFYDPLHGDIFIDEINVKDFQLFSLRSQMGMVLQDNLLFSGTIYDNIQFGNLNATKQQVIDASKMANAFNFIQEFPQGFNTQVGDQGKRLSGGQRQRISIARAFLRDPKILILDEATSALDSESEQVVQDALSVLMRGRTTFVVAHRLSTIKNADQILVLDKGRLIEFGNHEALLANKGKYFELYSIQFSS